MIQKPLLIYIAGPYSGNETENTREAILRAEVVVKKGHFPLIPHLTHFWDFLIPHPYEFWMKLDFEQLKRCDALYRMVGESKGADREVEFAIENNIPVYYSILDIPDVEPTPLPTDDGIFYVNLNT